MDLTTAFLGSAAVTAGLVTPDVLRGPRFARLFRGVYVPAGRSPTLALRSRAAYLLVAGRGALAGYSAAELLGAGVAPRDADAEVVVPGGDLREQPGLRVHRERLCDDEVVERDGLLVTSPVRTAYDLARWCPLVEGVVAVDALARVGRFGVPDLLALDRRRPGARWRQRVPRVAALADPLAQSPMETRARLVLVLRGLPPPVLQHQVLDENGDHVAYLDMAYPAARLGIEYEGAGHREDPAFGRDLVKHNRLQALQWVTLRITGADVYQRPDAFAAQVDHLLRRRGR